MVKKRKKPQPVRTGTCASLTRAAKRELRLKKLKQLNRANN